MIVMRVSTITLRAWRWLQYTSLKSPYLHKCQDEPFLTKQSRGCEGSDRQPCRASQGPLTRHTPRPSHCHEGTPLTPKGPPPTSWQCVVHGAQRGLVHGELFSPVPSQSRDPYTPSTTRYLWKEALSPIAPVGIFEVYGKRCSASTH
ncbi:hypothetical protein E2C01_090758 [Portunus trituberculatus]|uniref:Uncharacterized protein n=1 Tax=Portunus trituberculatus TaxID=210409 RepID=A0A5B7JHG4_PORTR|nr:hypothetical protein [Portunus trituberculatus]